MNTQEHLLVCLAEECAEVQHAVCKALRFGLHDQWPELGRTNGEQIEYELLDVLAVVELLRDNGFLDSDIDIQKRIDAKKAKVHSMMDYARLRGTLV